MRVRHLIPLAAAMLLTAACGQRPPERSPVPPIPSDLSFPEITTTTADPIPDDGTCYLVNSTGALVSSTQAGFDAENVLRSGDVITAIDAASVTSQESLLSVLAGYSPGEVVAVEVVREGELLELEAQLGSRPEDDTLPMLGVVVEPVIEPLSPGDVAPAAALLPGDHVAFADGDVYLLDPLAGSWRATGAQQPLGGLVVIGDRLYRFDPTGPGALVPLSGDGLGFAVPAGDKESLAALTTVADLVLVVSGRVDPENPTTAFDVTIDGADLVAGVIAWSWRPVGIEGTPGTPLVGYRSPDGSVALVTLDVAGVRMHTLFDASGPVAGFGTARSFAPDGAAFVGWYDDASLAYATVVDDRVVITAVDLGSLEGRPVVTLPAEESPRQVWSAGNGRHLMLFGDPDGRLYDVARAATGRPLSRNCAANIRTGPIG